MAKVAVPVGAMKAKAARFRSGIIVEIHGEGDIGQVVISVNGFWAAFHFGVAQFGPDLESTGGGSGPFTGGNKKVIDKIIIFISIETLVG